MSCADLAERQLAAYNAKDLDAFCACYADDVTVLDAAGEVTLSGATAFRARYAGLFAGWDVVGASVDVRDGVDPEVVDHERWWRSRAGEEASGRVRVRYVAREGRIAVVQFLPG